MQGLIDCMFDQFTVVVARADKATCNGSFKCPLRTALQQLNVYVPFASEITPLLHLSAAELDSIKQRPLPTNVSDFNTNGQAPPTRCLPPNPLGLRNPCGRTSYVNATIQAIIHSPRLMAAMAENSDNCYTTLQHKISRFISFASKSPTTIAFPRKVVFAVHEVEPSFSSSEKHPSLLLDFLLRSLSHSWDAKQQPPTLFGLATPYHCSGCSAVSSKIIWGSQHSILQIRRCHMSQVSEVQAHVTSLCPHASTMVLCKSCYTRNKPTPHTYMPRLPPTLVISYGDDSHDGVPDVVRAHAEQHAMPPATLPGSVFCPTSHATYTLHSAILMSTNGTQHYSALVYARPGWTHLDDEISSSSSLDPRPDATPTIAFYTLNPGTRLRNRLLMFLYGSKLCLKCIFTTYLYEESCLG
jgi:hypothetical protein